MSSHIDTHSDDEMEFHSDSGSETEYEPKPKVGAEDDDDTVERGEHESDIGAEPNQQGAQTSSTSMETDFILPGTPSIDCPSPFLAEWARGKFDPKSPLKQSATRITKRSGTGGTRKWRCNICGDVWYGSITRVNAHLFWTGKGVLPCKFLTKSKNLKLRIEFNKLRGVPEDLGLLVPTTLASRQQIQTIQEEHEQQMQGQQHQSMSPSRP